ncbi:MAG: hypothetical protein HFI64_14655 [Lachnospiraceae bacterium]|nr:hypothetical protein [Lachnospiraceae bacterium]
MEISFADGERAVKAIRVSLLADGTFFAAFDDYEIGPSDSFVEREDALTLREQTQSREREPERVENRERETESGESRTVPFSLRGRGRNGRW